ncbi:ATP-binding cassette domain-containing protein [Tenacibaculum agarivorans]|uniref:ATP-binding cassette domain-containing protein n=1 Tax=Tenacibaculum agarivorans TaxID=1908389 RepID=UPI00094B812C|nr:ATP-binding cassette domain-containing protein [Tenacibaculum agarivorans]
MSMKIQDMSFSFGKTKVFDNLSFSIKQNQVTAILGVSGCGKSTLIKLLANLYEPTEGQILYTNQEKPSEKEKAIIFQDSTLFPWKTVKQNIVLANEGNFIAVESIAKEVGLFEALDYYPNQLSGGMKQRAEFGRVLAKSPHFLFMDEPFSKLDVQFREHLQDTFLKIQNKTKPTTVFVTHDIREAIKVASNIKVLIGTPVSEVREYNVKNYEVKELIKEVSNILKKDFEMRIKDLYG